LRIIKHTLNHFEKATKIKDTIIRERIL